MIIKFKKNVYFVFFFAGFQEANAHGARIEAWECQIECRIDGVFIWQNDQRCKCSLLFGRIPKANHGIVYWNREIFEFLLVPVELKIEKRFI